MSESIPPDDLDIDILRDRLRVAERKLALAEAQIALSAVAPAPVWAPTDASAAKVVDGLSDLSAAIDILFHTAEVAMVLLTEDGIILRANQPAAELWGLPISEICGRRTADMTAPEDKARTERALAARGRGQFLLKTYIRPDGTRVPALTMGWPLVDDDGNTVCLLGVAVPTSGVTVTPSMLEAVGEALGRTTGRREPGGEDAVQA